MSATSTGASCTNRSPDSSRLIIKPGWFLRLDLGGFRSEGRFLPSVSRVWTCRGRVCREFVGWPAVGCLHCFPALGVTSMVTIFSHNPSSSSHLLLMFSSKMTEPIMYSRPSKDNSELGTQSTSIPKAKNFLSLPTEVRQTILTHSLPDFNFDNFQNTECPLRMSDGLRIEMHGKDGWHLRRWKCSMRWVSSRIMQDIEIVVWKNQNLRDAVYFRHFRCRNVVGGCGRWRMGLM